MIYINITNSFNTRRWTGIQRVAREVCRHLCATRDDVRLVVFKPSGIYALSHEAAIQSYLSGQESESVEKVELSGFVPGDTLLEIDANWGDWIDYYEVVKQIKKQGAKYVKMHYDAVPLLFPQFSHQDTVYNFSNDFYTAMRLADHWICNTEVVQNDLQRLHEKMKYGSAPASVVPLGADLSVQRNDEQGVSEPVRSIGERRIILTVGTIEPRKNHDLVLNAFDAYCAKSTRHADACLVIVGKSGWNNEAIERRITTHPALNKDLFWFSSASDEDLDYLYQKAWVCLCLSHYEGFGLPAVEALLHRVPVICTAGSAMEEAAQGRGHAIAKEAGAVADAIVPYLMADAPLRIEDYVPTTWGETASSVAGVIERLQFADAGFEDMPTQVVYISIRPGKLRRSLDSVALRMKFIQEAVVLTADSAYDEMAAALQGLSLNVTLLRESEIGLAILPKDHQKRNTLLRKALYAAPQINRNFIGFDDDYVVAAEVSPTVFIENGQHKAYFFFRDGREWQGAFPAPSSFDRGAWRTAAYLDQSGYGTKLYSAHQPQIINKSMAAYIYGKTDGLGLDEWSSYFNIAAHLKPDGFESREYVAAGWPGDFNAWTGHITPSSCLFYNDPPTARGDDELSGHVHDWLTGLKSARQAQAQVVSSLPMLYVAGGKAWFNERRISCAPAARFKIPIKVLGAFESIEWNYLDHRWSFTQKNAPAFIYIKMEPASDLEGPVDLQVHVKRSNGESLSAELAINVASEDKASVAT